MRILHVNGSGHRVGGVETYLADLVRAQTGRGDSVGLLATDESTDFCVSAFHPISGDRGAIRDFVTGFEPDLIHIHDFCLPLDVEGDLRRDYTIVDFFHDFSFACSSGEHYFRGGTACNRSHGPGCLANLFFRGCAHRADIREPLDRYRTLNRRLPLLRETRAVVASRYMRSVAIGNGLDPRRCDVTPYFVRRPTAPPPPSAEAVLAFVGRISSNKGLDTLLRALVLVRERWDRLIVSGDGWALPDCRRLSAKLGLDPKVSFRGWCGSDEIFRVLENARVVAVPSSWPEPFGMVGIEAMARARPVVASRAGGIPEWLDDGDTGLLVEAGSEQSLARAIDVLLADPDRAASMGREGWQRAERFSLEEHIGRLDAAYERALSERARAQNDTGRQSPTASVHV
jgi:glycosyltransferase involved in cell wall biosynthesis